jgi:hypothetical protein
MLYFYYWIDPMADGAVESAVETWAAEDSDS